MAQVESSKAGQAERVSPPKVGRTTWTSMNRNAPPPRSPNSSTTTTTPRNGPASPMTAEAGRRRPPLPLTSPTTTPTTTATTTTRTTTITRPSGKVAAAVANIEIRSSSTMPDRDYEDHDTHHHHLHNHIVVRHTKSEDKMPRKLDKFGFIVNMDSHGNVYDDHDDDHERIPTFAEVKRTERRERKWNLMLQSGGGGGGNVFVSNRRRRRKVLRRLRKGLPDNLRGRVWPVLGNVPAKRTKDPHLYSDLVRRTTEDVIHTAVHHHHGDTPLELPLTAEELTKHSRSFLAIHDTIERDIHRTYPRHNLFYDGDSNPDDSSTAGSEEDHIVLGLLCDGQVSSLIQEFENNDRRKKTNTTNTNTTTSGTSAPPTPPRNELMDAQGGQAALRRVLRAYSLYDREVGYCQGMNFIAGMFLTFLTEEEAFWLLVVVMKEPPCRMRGLFGEGMSETHEVLFIAEKLMHQFLPKLTKHMEKENVHITMYATQWLLTLYTSSFPFDLVTRVWDCFLVEGWKVVYRVMLALLTLWQSAMLKMSFEEILAFFRDFSSRVDGHTVMEAALKIPLKTKHILKYQTEWRTRQAQLQKE